MVEALETTPNRPSPIAGGMAAATPGGAIRRLLATLADMVLLCSLCVALALPVVRTVDWTALPGRIEELTGLLGDTAWVGRVSGVLGMWIALWWCYFVVGWGLLGSDPRQVAPGPARHRPPGPLPDRRLAGGDAAVRVQRELADLRHRPPHPALPPRPLRPARPARRHPRRAQASASTYRSSCHLMVRLAVPSPPLPLPCPVPVRVHARARSRHGEVLRTKPDPRPSAYPTARGRRARDVS